MQTLCYFYIFIIILLKNLEGASDVEEQQMPRLHLSRKLNPADCQRQVDAHWPDKLPETDEDYVAAVDAAAPRRSVIRRRRRIETPNRFVVRLPIERSDRVRRHPRKRRKRKRSEPSIDGDEFAANDEIGIEEQEEDEELVGNKEGKPNNAPAAAESNQAAKSQVALIVLAVLLALILVALLLAYLTRRSHNKHECDPFFCPPEIGRSPDNLEEIDRCTCCSERMDESPPSRRYAATRPPTRRNSPSPPPPPPPMKKEKQKKVKMEKRVKSRQPTPSQSRLSEAELRLIQSRIACILRNDCAACQCCKCDAAADVGHPKAKRSKFKLFRKKPKPKPSCGDRRCGEDRIKRLTGLWNDDYYSDSTSRVADSGGGSPREPLLPNPCAANRKTHGLRIKE